MLLVDKLVKQPDLHKDPASKAAYQALADDLLKAERFVLHEDAVAAMFQVSQSKATNLSLALPWARAPYPLMWFEWPQSYINLAETTATAAPVQEDKKPNRTGILIRTLGAPDRGVMTLCWDFPGERVAHFSMIQQLYDWREVDGDVLALSRSHGLFFPFPVKSASSSPMPASVADTPHLSKAERKILQSDDERAALREMYQTLCPAPSKYWFPKAGPDGRVYASREAFDDAMISWYGEPAFVAAVLLLLNVKRYVKVTVPDVSKRMARRAKPKRLPFSEVRLVMPDHQRERAAGQGADKAEIRRHLVRGHFKIRKTGVFWWGHYPRGSGSPLKRRGYNVRS